MTIVPIDKARREAGEWSDEPEGSERPELLKQTNREFTEKVKKVYPEITEKGVVLHDKPKFDRVAYQREYMRKWRAKK